MSRSKKGDIRHFRELFRYIAPYKFYFAFGLICLVVTSLLSLCFPWLLGEIVNSGKMRNEDGVYRYTYYLLGILLVQAFFSYFRVYTFSVVSERSLNKLKEDAYQKILKLPMSFFDRSRIGALSSRLSSDITLLKETFTTTLAEFLRQFIVIFGSLIILIATLPELMLFMMIVFPPIVFFAVYLGKKIKHRSKQVQRIEAQSGSIVEEALTSIFNVKAFNYEEFESIRYASELQKVIKASLSVARLRAVLVSIIVFGLFGSVVAVICKGSLMISEGDILAGDLTAFIMYSIFIGAGVAGLADFYSKLQRSLGASDHILKILSKEDEGSLRTSMKDHQICKDVDPNIVLSFDSVNFSYPQRSDHPVLKDFSFEVKRDQKVALVGQNGSGKSTVARLILRMYDTYTGNITFNRKDIRGQEIYTLRKKMAIVPQDTLLFGFTIYENIAFGNPRATKSEVLDAASKANVMEFVKELPHGFDTYVGERGTQLSGGQKQRVAIARAILKQSEFLILDEAMASLDASSEHKIQSALNQLLENKTALIITHNIESMKMVDHICHIQAGKIVEQGTYDALISNPNSAFYKTYAEHKTIVQP